MVSSIKLDGVYSVQQYNLQTELQDCSIAICPEINFEIQRVTWKDGERGRIVDYTKRGDLEIEFPASRVTVTDNNNSRLYVLQPLTLKIYKDNIKDRLSGHPDFETDQEMTDFFLSKYRL